MSNAIENKVRATAPGHDLKSTGFNGAAIMAEIQNTDVNSHAKILVEQMEKMHNDNVKAMDTQSKMFSLAFKEQLKIKEAQMNALEKQSDEALERSKSALFVAVFFGIASLIISIVINFL